MLTHGVGQLDDGMYHYRADEHLLERRCLFKETEQVKQPLLLLGLSSGHWREAWKYGERAYRYCQHDFAALQSFEPLTGHTVQP